MNNRDRLIRYVRRAFKRAHMESWPTVKQCARGLKLPMEEIELLADEGSPLMLTSYFVKPEPPLAEHFVEICE